MLPKKSVKLILTHDAAPPRSLRTNTMNNEELKKEYYDKYVQKQPSIIRDFPVIKGDDIEGVWDFITTNFISKQEHEEIRKRAYGEGAKSALESIIEIAESEGKKMVSVDLLKDLNIPKALTN